jgi:hypothetical protein
LTLNEWLVRKGLAFNFEPYAHGRFKVAENDARSNHLGLWTGCFAMPQEFRHGNKHAAILFGQSCDDKGRNLIFPDNPRMPPTCSIKGKRHTGITGYIGIYHTEGCRSYQQTKSVDRWFCSEEDAQAAGFRKAFNCAKR